MKKHQEHIVCIKASKVKNRSNGFVNYDFILSDLMLGMRSNMELDDDFRQVLPIAVFTCKGKIWAYERTSKGGEIRLRNKVSISCGGHWDMADICLENGIIDLEKSMAVALQREIEEEIKLTSKVVKVTRLKNMICADDTEVDRVHIGIIYLYELDGEGVDSAEDKLKTIGFLTPDELLSGDYNAEVWTTIICKILKEQ